MANELTVTKQQTARFVHDAVEMETAVFTIDRAIEECEREKRECVENARNELRMAEDNIRSIQHSTDFDYNRAVQEAESWLKTPVDKAMIAKAMGIALFVGAIVTAFIAAMIMSATFTLSEDTLPSWVPWVGGIIIAVLIGIILFKREKADNERYYRKKLNEANEIRAQAEISINSAKSQLTTAKNKLAYVNSRVEVLDRQCGELLKNKWEIEETLTNFYNLGVIPPQYRTFDCAIVLDHYFRNDLVDTMREAILMYREDVKHGEIIEGMDKICSMLGQLSAGMVMIEQRLNSIDSNVKMMSQDLYTFSERIAAGQAKQQKATEQLIRETEMSRYATEQVAESAKNLEWHERRRQGWV